MYKKNQPNPALGTKAMEMVMRDVLDGMQDLVIMNCYESTRNVFEIMAITPPDNSEIIHVGSEERKNTGPVAEILPFNRQSRG